MKSDIWEYTHYNTFSLINFSDSHLETQLLNSNFGEKGWELVTVIERDMIYDPDLPGVPKNTRPEKEKFLTHIFKRKKI